MKKLHFTGIGGAGMAPLAQLSLARGMAVSGSDAGENEKCRSLRDSGAAVYTGHDRDFLPDDAEMLIYSSAIPADNPERCKAAELGIRELRRGEYLAELASGYRRCTAVTGTHGKSSISAALSSILLACGKDPGFMIGAQVAGLPSCAAGNGDIFVTEADESDGTHALLKNFLAVIPNIEDDHEWSLGGREVLENNFRQVAANSENIIYYASAKCDQLLGEHPNAVRLTEVPENFAGLHGFQAANAYIAYRAAILLGCDPEEAERAAGNYPQVARRMTVHFAGKSLTVIEDYAHHPTEVAAAVEFLRKNYPGRHLRILFQPHRFARLEKYFDEFVRVLKKADSVVVAPVFAAWSESGKVDHRQLAAAVGGISADGDYRQWAQTALQELPSPGVIAVLGAGDIDQVIPLLCQK